MPTVMLIYRTRNGRVLHRPTFPASRGSFFSPGQHPAIGSRRVTLSSRSSSPFRRLSFLLLLLFLFLYRACGRVTRLNILLPFEMFDDIFVGGSAVFPDRPGPVDHKEKRHLRYDGGNARHRDSLLVVRGGGEAERGTG